MKPIYLRKWFGLIVCFWAYYVQATPHTIGYHYDAFSRLASTQYDNILLATRQYDAYNSVVQLTYQQATHLILSLLYHYNTQGQITSVDHNEGETHNQMQYRYDADHNLKQFTCTGSPCPKDEIGKTITSQQYNFDALNNIKRVTSNNTVTEYEYSTAVPTRLLRFQNSNHAYPSSPLLQYDPAGHLYNDGYHHTLTYTPFEQIEAISQTNANSSSIRYTYNGDDQQVASASPSHPPVYFLYGQKQLFNQLQDGHQTSYLYGTQQLGEQTDHQLISWYLTNLQGSILHTIQTSVNDARMYSPYGLESSVHTTAHNTHIGFDGQLTDGYTGWQFLGQGYRAYSAQLRRFIQQDALSPFGKGGINGYLFSNNDPINQFDPNGHFPYQILGNTLLMVGLFFGFISGFATTESLAVATGIVDNALNGAGMILTNLSNEKTFNTKNFVTDMSLGLFSGVTMGIVGGKLFNMINEADDQGLNLLRERAYNTFSDKESTPQALSEIAQAPKPGSMTKAFLAYGARTSIMEAVRTVSFELPAQLIKTGKIDWRQTMGTLGVNLAVGFTVGGFTNALATRGGNILSLNDMLLDRGILPGGISLQAFFLNVVIGTALQLGLPKSENFIYQRIGLGAGM